MGISVHSRSRLWVTSQTLVGQSHTPGLPATTDTDSTGPEQKPETVTLSGQEEQKEN